MRRTLHITLREGFRGHSVVILVDGRPVYNRGGVTTDPAMSQADAVGLIVPGRRIDVTIAVTPGNYAGVVSVDVRTHSHLAISLVGEGTVGFQTFADGVR